MEHLYVYDKNTSLSGHHMVSTVTRSLFLYHHGHELVEAKSVIVVDHFSIDGLLERDNFTASQYGSSVK